MSVNYHSSHYEIIDRMERKHFWYVERNSLIKKLCERFLLCPKGTRFLEIGCGTGAVLPIIESLGCKVTGMDINQKALIYARQKSHASLVRSALSSYTSRKKYDAIGIFDVLEHQRDDHTFLKTCRTFIRPGGYLFVTVPACSWAFSAIDTVSGHHRRYNKEEIKEKLKHAGFSICFLNYWNILLFGLYLLWRLQFLKTSNTTSISTYLDTPPAFINQCCRYILQVERMFLFTFAFPIGSSLVVVAKRI